MAVGAAILLLHAGAGGAQTAGAIGGRVVDSSSSALSGATVEATGSSLPTRAARTGNDGGFLLPGMPPGTYRLRVSLAGFRPAESQVDVAAGVTSNVDFSLEVAIEESVLVANSPLAVDLTSTATGTSYGATVISRLPVVRNYADVVTSNPGVSLDRGETQGGRNLPLAIDGATSAENQWSIDGVNTTGVAFGTQGKAISREFVEEVQVVTGGYPAEYGRALGGLVTVVTKSGGNQLHGEGFLYFDSFDTIAQKVFRPEEDSSLQSMGFTAGDRFDYGVDLGGYILKDRLWFFAGYNPVHLGAEVSRVTPSRDVSIDDRFPLDSADAIYSGKLTWNVSPETTLVGTVFADRFSSSGAAAADPRQTFGTIGVRAPFSLDPATWDSRTNQGGTDYGIRLTQLLGVRAALTAQASSHHDRNDLTPTGDGVNYRLQTCEGGTPDDPCNPPRADPISESGGFGVVPTGNVSSRRQFAAGVAIFEGNHALKAGGDYLDDRTQGTSYWTGGSSLRLLNEYGQLYYLHRFYSVSADDPTPVPSIFSAARALDSSAYAQDSWRIAAGVTLNVGLRWDGQRTKDYVGRTVLSLVEQWQPRLGLAWDPWHDGRTRISASLGRFSYDLPTEQAAAAFGDFTVRSVYNFDPNSLVQDPNVIHYSQSIVESGGGPFGSPVDPGVRAAYQDELTIGAERLLNSSLTVGLQATYRRLGTAIENRCDLNPDDPLANGSTCAIINPGSNAIFARGGVSTCNGLDGDWLDCDLSDQATPPAKRIYRGIQLLARYAVGTRLWIQASYVYSSLRGNYDGGVNENTYGEATPGGNSDFDFPALWHNAYGILSLDRPHRGRLDGYWASPWRVSLGLRSFVESGAPRNRMGWFDDTYGSAVYLLPRGSAGRLPVLWRVDLTLQYPIAIGPATLTVEGSLENVFNKQIPISRDDAWSNGPPEGFPATIFDPDQDQNNSNYGKVTGRQDPRAFRAAMHISF